MSELVIRFLVGGVVVSFFAMLGDVLRPKSLAGLFSAAPSVALATLALTIHKDGKPYAAQEAKTMLLGAAGFLLYAALVGFVLRRYKPSALTAAFALLPIWFAVSLGSWMFLSGRW
jgi:urea transporter